MAELDRRQLRKISPDSDEVVYVATAEDTVLAKLRWYRAGHEISSNQWNDVVGILGTSLDTLDLHYLRTAEELGLTDLLEKLLAMCEKIPAHENKHHWWWAGGVVFCDPDAEGRCFAHNKDL